jgi:hypothetical protein
MRIKVGKSPHEEKSKTHNGETPDELLKGNYVYHPRDEEDDPIFKNLVVYRLFWHCVTRAKYKTGDYFVDGQMVHLERGQLDFSLRKESKNLGIPRQQLRTGLNILLKYQKLTHQPTHRISTVSVCNYEIYQGREKAYQHTDQPTVNPLPTHSRRESGSGCGFELS